MSLGSVPSKGDGISASSGSIWQRKTLSKEEFYLSECKQDCKLPANLGFPDQGDLSHPEMEILKMVLLSICGKNQCTDLDLLVTAGIVTL